MPSVPARSWSMAQATALSRSSVWMPVQLFLEQSETRPGASKRGESQSRMTCGSATGDSGRLFTNVSLDVDLIVVREAEVGRGMPDPGGRLSVTAALAVGRPAGAGLDLGQALQGARGVLGAAQAGEVVADTVGLPAVPLFGTDPVA